MVDATIIEGDALANLKELSDDSVQCVVTSPPYWGLRDYGCEGQIGKEDTPEGFLGNLVEVFREVRRVLRSDGTCWINMGDSYAGAGYSNHANTGGALRCEGAKQIHCLNSGLKSKDLIGMPWRLAFALQADGWWLRQDIIWAKPNPMPESVLDRCTKAHEYLFLLTKSSRYYYDADAIRTPFALETKALSFDTMDFGRRDEYAIAKRHLPGKKSHKGTTAYESGAQEHRTKAGLVQYAIRMRDSAPSHRGSSFTSGKTAATKPTIGRGLRKDHALGSNKRSVWVIPTEGYPEAHFATFPVALVTPCILAGTKVGDVVLDPFSGAGTTGVAALRLSRKYLGIELNPEYVALSQQRIKRDAPLLRQDLFPKED